MDNIKKFNDEEDFINPDIIASTGTIPPADTSVPVVDGPVMNPEPEPTELTPSIEENPVVIDGGEGENLPGDCPDGGCSAEPIPTPDVTEPTPEVTEPTPAPEASGYCSTDNLTLGEFFGTLMESVQIAWRYHLKATNHSTHVILEEYYSDAQEIIDTIIESYQGRFGVITEYGNRICDFDKSCLGYFQELRDFIENGKLMLPEINCSSEILSEIDTLTTKVDTTLYKLRNLTESKKRPFKSFEEFIND